MSASVPEVIRIHEKDQHGSVHPQAQQITTTNVKNRVADSNRWAESAVQPLQVAQTNIEQALY